jgi:hypothetical protein
MLYKILAQLFQRDFDTPYYAKPQDIIYPLAMMGVGTASLFYEKWKIFGILSIILGYLMGLTIELCINWDKIISYWETINEHVKLMERNKDPDLWMALGYKSIPDKVQVIEKEDKGQGSFSWKISNIPIPVTNMNMLSNKVLGSGDVSFTEERYGNIVPNFRKVRKDWIAQNVIKLKNAKNSRLGYKFTKKGIDVLYEFASQEFKLKER